MPHGQDLGNSQDDVALPAGACSHDHCFAPATNCLLGERPMANCANWQRDSSDSAVLVADGERPPWSGFALGSVDVSGVAATRRARMVALVGGVSAGKTSLLAALFIQLRSGYRIGGMRFAGSYTLLGWDQIALHAEFPPKGTRGFPPHTTSGRLPALLHVRLASGSSAYWDIYFTDVPGEWFEEWAYEAEDIPGARWIAERADLFVLLSDADALSGPTRGLAWNSYRVLASRVSSVAHGREVYPVRSKSDLMAEVPDTIDEALKRRDAELFGATAAPLSVIAESSVPDALHALDEIIRRATVLQGFSVREPKRSSDPFLGFRSSMEQA